MSVDTAHHEHPQHHPEVLFFVDDEPIVVHTHELTVKEILDVAGFEPADEYYLVRLKPREEYRDLNTKVPIKNDDRFIAVFHGPTPVS